MALGRSCDQVVNRGCAAAPRAYRAFDVKAGGRHGGDTRAIPRQPAGAAHASLRAARVHGGAAAEPAPGGHEPRRASRGKLGQVLAASPHTLLEPAVGPGGPPAVRKDGSSGPGPADGDRRAMRWLLPRGRRVGNCGSGSVRKPLLRRVGRRRPCWGPPGRAAASRTRPGDTSRSTRASPRPEFSPRLRVPANPRWTQVQGGGTGGPWALTSRS